MYTPPNEVHTACLRAALATTVPLSLLEALAYVASHYNPHAEGPARGDESAGGKGLFLLGPRVLEQLHVSDPFSAAQNARAAADVLRALGDRYAWAEDSMIVGFIWGGAKLSRMMAEPIARRAPLPASVKAKLDEVRSARAWLLDRARPIGSTLAERLDNAIRGAAAANAAWPPAVKLLDQWNLMIGTQRTARTPSAINALGLERALSAYRDGYLRLPVTDSRTPLPERLSGPAAPPQPEAPRPASSPPPSSSSTRWRLSQPAVGGLLLLGLLGFRSGRRRSVRSVL